MMNARNIAMTVDTHVLEALDEVRAEKEDAMDKYVDAARREAELLALVELRKAMGARIAGLPHAIGISASEAAA